MLRRNFAFLCLFFCLFCLCIFIKIISFFLASRISYITLDNKGVCWSLRVWPHLLSPSFLQNLLFEFGRASEAGVKRIVF